MIYIYIYTHLSKHESTPAYIGSDYITSEARASTTHLLGLWWFSGVIESLRRRTGVLPGVGARRPLGRPLAA